MKKEYVLKTVLIVICSILLIALTNIAIQLRVGILLNLETTYIAARNIPPRTQIQESDLLEIRIPHDYIMEYACQNRNEIIGKYTEIQGMIPAGSVFYSSMLFEEDELPDYPSLQLKEGQSAFTLETDLEKLGGSVVPGQRVDIYVSITRRDGLPLTGCLVEHVRVISIKDHKGLETSSVESDGIPHLVLLAVNESDLKYLSAAEGCGQLRLFSSVKTYDTSQEARLLQEGEIYRYLTQSDNDQME